MVLSGTLCCLFLAIHTIKILLVWPQWEMYLALQRELQGGGHPLRGKTEGLGLCELETRKGAAIKIQSEYIGKGDFFQGQQDTPPPHSHKQLALGLSTLIFPYTYLTYYMFTYYMIIVFFEKPVIINLLCT